MPHFVFAGHINVDLFYLAEPLGCDRPPFEGTGLEDRGWSECFYLERCLDSFLEQVAERILCIPLSLFMHEDSLVWRGELSGEYPIRSGLKILLKLKFQFGDSCVTICLLLVIFTIEEC